MEIERNYKCAGTEMWFVKHHYLICSRQSIGQTVHNLQLILISYIIHHICVNYKGFDNKWTIRYQSETKGVSEKNYNLNS